MIRVGPAGWAYADWEGVVYPQPRPQGFHPLAYISRFVDCIEINSSFYGFPRAEHAEVWRRLVSDRANFRFVAKLHQSFTHAPLDDRFATNQAKFVAGIRPLGERLSAILVQFPLSFRDTSDSRIRLEQIKEAFDAYSLVVELRHRSWYARDKLDWLVRTGYSLVAIDLPSACVHPPGDSPSLGRVGYLRLHGRNADAWFDSNATKHERYDYLYSHDEIAGITERARQVAANADDAFVVTNNHFMGKAVANAIDILNALSGEVHFAPPTLVERFPHLGANTRLTGQSSLF